MKLQAEYARIKGYTELWIAYNGGMEKVKESVKNYRVNGGTVAAKCVVCVSCDGVEFTHTYRFVWWNQHGLCWQVAKDLREVAEWQKEEAARKTALREWADTL